jgi:hypothetical protein
MNQGADAMNPNAKVLASGSSSQIDGKYFDGATSPVSHSATSPRS